MVIVSFCRLVRACLRLTPDAPKEQIHAPNEASDVNSKHFTRIGTLVNFLATKPSSSKINSDVRIFNTSTTTCSKNTTFGRVPMCPQMCLTLQLAQSGKNTGERCVCEKFFETISTHRGRSNRFLPNRVHDDNSKCARCVLPDIQFAQKLV